MITLAPYFEQYEFNYKQIILLPSRKNIYKIQWGSVDQKHSKQDIFESSIQMVRFSNAQASPNHLKSDHSKCPPLGLFSNDWAVPVFK